MVFFIEGFPYLCSHTVIYLSLCHFLYSDPMRHRHFSSSHPIFPPPFQEIILSQRHIFIQSLQSQMRLLRVQVDVIYTLLDEDGDENLSTREFNPILFQWRHSRGFQKGSLAMSVGSLRF